MADTTLINLDEAVRGLGDKALAGIGKAEKQMEAREAANRKAAEGIRGDMAEMEDVTARMRDLEVGREPPEAPEFEEFQAPEEQYNPVEAFGSTASVLGIMASLMTKQPLTSALNAGAGVMEAYKQKDVEAYNKAFKEWESNSNQALKFAQFERGLYQDALQKHGNDLNALQAEFRTIAAQTQNQALLATLESGDPQATLNLVNSLSKAANDLPGIVSSAKDMGLENQAVLQDEQRWFAENPNVPYPAEREIQVRSQARRQLEQSRRGVGSEMNQYLLGVSAEYERALEEAERLPPGPERDAAIREANRVRDRKLQSVSRGGVRTGARGAFLTNLAQQEEAEIADARERLSGPELDAEIKRIRQRNDRQREMVYEGQGETAFTKALAPQEAETVTTHIEEGKKAVNDLVEIDRLEAALESGRFRTGVLSAPRYFISQALDFAGVDPNEVGLGLGDPATADTLEAASNRLALEVAQDMSRMTNMQLSFLRDSLPRLTRTEEGNRVLAEVMKRMAERKIQVGRLADDYARERTLRPAGKPSFYDAVLALDEADPIIDEGLKERIMEGTKYGEGSWKEQMKKVGLSPDHVFGPALPPGSISVPASLADSPDGTVVRDKESGRVYVIQNGWMVPRSEAPE